MITYDCPEMIFNKMVRVLGLHRYQVFRQLIKGLVPAAGTGRVGWHAGMPTDPKVVRSRLLPNCRTALILGQLSGREVLMNKSIVFPAKCMSYN